MKTRLLVIALAISFTVILGGAIFLASIAEDPLAADIKFDPKFIEWDGAGPSVWRVWIQSEVWNPAYVDGDSVMFEHTVPAITGYYEQGKWIAEFDGSAVFAILQSTVGHMGVPPDISTKTPVHYYFTVSGELVGAKDYPDGTPFEGESWIAVRFVYGLPDPPPPIP